MNIEQIKDRIRNRMGDLKDLGDEFPGDDEYSTLQWVMDMLENLEEEK